MSPPSGIKASAHDDQMTVARELQANRTPIGVPWQPNRGRGGQGGRACGDGRRFSSSFGSHTITSSARDVTTATSSTAVTSHGNQASTGCGLLATSTGGGGNPSGVRPGTGGRGLSSSIWAPSLGPEYVLPYMRGRASAPSSSHEPAAFADSMAPDEPATNTAISSDDSPAASPDSFDPESAADGSASENAPGESSILDEPVPDTAGLPAALRPIRTQTLFPRSSGLASSRWAPREF